jgi:integral membrane protein
MKSALLRYRVVAWATGLMLLFLVFVAMPLKYIGNDPHWVEVIGPVHGALYALYVLIAFDLAIRAKWGLGRTVWLLLAGTIPFASFYADRSAHRSINA